MRSSYVSAPASGQDTHMVPFLHQYVTQAADDGLRLSLREVPGEIAGARSQTARMRVVWPLTNLRRATLDDLDALLANVQAGFDSYAAFAPVGWQTPSVSADRDRSAELLADPATWTLIVLADGDPAGHVAFFPARERSAGGARSTWKARSVVPGLAHLWQLFVLPEWWGRGVAPLLHEAAIAERQSQNYQHARLFTPSRHARARRFYERRGWLATEEEWNDELALMLTEYRLALG